MSKILIILPSNKRCRWDRISRLRRDLPSQRQIYSIQSPLRVDPPSSLNQWERESEDGIENRRAKPIKGGHEDTPWFQSSKCSIQLETKQRHSKDDKWYVVRCQVQHTSCSRAQMAVTTNFTDVYSATSLIFFLKMSLKSQVKPIFRHNPWMSAKIITAPTLKNLQRQSLTQKDIHQSLHKHWWFHFPHYYIALLHSLTSPFYYMRSILWTSAARQVSKLQFPILHRPIKRGIRLVFYGFSEGESQRYGLKNLSKGQYLVVSTPF